MGSEHIDDAKKAPLKSVYDQLDPFELKAKIERKLKAIFKLVSVTANVRNRL